MKTSKPDQATVTEAAMDEGAAGSSEGKARKSIQSVEIGVGILEIMMESPFSGMRLKDISDRSGMSSSQVHRYLLSYVNMGIVAQDRATGRYSLGPMALRLGIAALSRLDSIRIASDILDALVLESRFTGVLTIWGDYGPVVIRYVPGLAPMVTSLNVGSVLPLQVSAVGIIYLAFDQANKLSTVLQRERERGVAIEPKLLAEKIAFAQEHGYVRSDGLVIPGLAAIAAPILDMCGYATVTLGLTASAADKSFLSDNISRVILAAAGKASAANGWLGKLGKEQGSAR